MRLLLQNQKVKTIRVLVNLLIFFLLIFKAQAQLSDLHYLPPLKQYSNNNAIIQQRFYLSTPEAAGFDVKVYQGTNGTAIATLVGLSNTNSLTYNVANGDNNITLVTNANTGNILTTSGLRFESTGGKKFYVNYRGRHTSQAASLTSKGRSAFGTQFKWGGIPLRSTNTASQSATLGIMATEANTDITISGYDTNCVFRQGSNAAGITTNTITINLDAGESYVLEALLGQAAANEDGWLGANITSTKDIVVSNGGLLNMINAGSASRDAGIDQAVPEDILGNEYVFVRGNGVDAMERPIIIAIQDNTEVFVNGSTTPIATLNNGDYFDIPGSNYSSSSAGGNMYVTTSNRAYAYQALAGSSSEATGGLNFIAPVNCLMPTILDNIPDIRNVAGLNFSGGITIIASTSTLDANISVTDGSGPVTLPASSSVAGSSDWKTFFVSGLTGNVSVNSTGPISVGFLGASGSAGIAGYFSGFDTAPVVDVQITGGGCLPSGTVEEVTGTFDGYQWYMDGVAIPGATSSSYTPPSYVTFAELYVEVTLGTCTFPSDPITVYDCSSDIVLTKTADATTYDIGDTVSYTITAESKGVDPVTNLVITDVLPNGLTLVSGTPSAGSWSSPNWTIGTINSGEKHTLTITATVNNDIREHYLINTITNTQDQVDSNNTVDDPTETILIDFDGDSLAGIDDLDSDNDGILDINEGVCKGTSSNPFTSLGAARSVAVAGIYHFDLNGQTFSTYVNKDGYVQVAIDYGNGSGNLPQSTSLTNSTRGLLNNTSLAELTDANEIRLSSSTGEIDITSSNATLLTRLVAGQTLHTGLGDNTLHDDWTGTQEEYLKENATCTTTAGTSLAANIFHPCGNTFTVHWIPSSGSVQLRNDLGNIGASESLTLWVRAGDTSCSTDTDSDQKPDYLDTDSDNDGCYDALEASGAYNYTQLSSGALTGGVDADGIPTITSGGQATTVAVIDSSDSTACCAVSVSGFADVDSDGIADSCDLDNDNDGILDSVENDRSCIITDVGSNSGGTSGFYLNDLGEIVNYTATSPSPIFSGNSCVAGGTRPNCAGEDYSSVTGSTNVNVGRTFTVTFDRIVNDVTFILGCMEAGRSGDFVTNTSGSQSITSNCPTETTIINNSSVSSSVTHNSFFTVELTVASIVGFTEVTYTTTSTNGGTVNMKICPALDTDGDGTPDHLDTDSDDDGCYDALEGAGSYVHTQLSSGAFTGGVDSNGVPSTVSGGQATTSGVTDSSDNSACCQVSVSGFADVDSDGIANSCDLDNDNDGILDINERACYAFSDNFGTGTGSPATSHPNVPAANVANVRVGTNADFAGQSWYQPNSGLDASGESEGRYLALDNPVGVAPVLVYQESITVQANEEYSYSLFALAAKEANGQPASAYPNVRMQIKDGSGTVLQTIDTGTLTLDWQRFEFLFTSTTTNVTVEIYNNNADAPYNTLLIDEISISLISCDTDGDGTPDYLDLDSDNDGCYDALEAAGSYTHTQLSSGVFTGGVDANGVPLTTSGGQGTAAAVTDSSDSTACCDVSVSGFTDVDSDGVADACDLDNDNDGILDTIENPCTGSIQYEFYNNSPSGGTVDNIPITGAISTGSVTNFDLVTLVSSIPSASDAFSVRYKGLILISEGGNYTFYTNSDDGSKLYINGIEIVDNDGPHPIQERSGNINLGIGYHQIEVEYFDIGGLESLQVQYEGPSIVKQDIPFSSLTCLLDTDGDGTPDYLDLDSDNDGCNDVIESGGIDSGGDGVLDGTGFDGNGQVTGGSGGYNGVTGNEIEATKVQISLNPNNTIICEGSDVNFFALGSSLSTTSFSGTAPTTTPDYTGSTSTLTNMVYQWQVQVGGMGPWNNITNGGVYSGVSLASLTLTNPPSTFSTNKYRLLLTSTKNVCASAISSEVTLTINPKPVNTTPPTDTVCSGEALSHDLAPDVTLSGNTFIWLAANNPNVDGETIVVSGATTIADVLTNTSGSVQTVIYTITPVSSNICSGDSYEYTVTVNPEPDIVSAPTDNICSGLALNHDLTSDVNIPGTTFSWVVADNINVTGETTGISTTTSITDTLINTSNSLQTVTYTITPTSGNGCTGDPYTYTVTIDALPVVSDQSDQALCDTTDFTMTQTAPTVGTGVWSIVSGTATITTASSPTTTVTGLVAGTSATLRWTVTNGTCSVFDEVVITNDVLPVVSDQSDQALCDTTDFTMTQTAPTVGTGVWSIVSGTATITTASSPTTTVTGLVAGTSATLRWTVTNGTCSVFDEVVITNDVLPVVSDQSDQTLCDTTDFTMTQTAPTVGTGVWSIVSGTATITTASSPTTTVTGLVAGTSATLRWTVTNGTCSVFDEVVITNDILPVVSDQSDQALCDTTDFTMTQTAPTVGTGVWSIVSGTATITTTSSPTTTVTGLVAGTSTTLRWTVTNGTCSVFDEVVITNDILPVVSDQSDQALCDTTDFTMTQTAPTVGTGVWSIISGTATITTTSSPTTTVTGLVAGTSATLRWTVTNGTCSVFDEVVITNDILPVVSDQSDQALCDTTDFTMTQTAPTVGTGVWSIVSGTATITTTSSPTTTVTGLVAGTSATLRWTVTNGTCSVFDEVIITNDVLPVVSDQSDQALCDTTDFTMTQTAPIVGTGVWSIVSGTATITTASSPTTTVTGLVAGTSATLRWTVTNGTCSVFDEVVITNDVLPVVSDQSDQALCDTTDFTMTQTAPIVGTGVWSIVSGTATITTASSPTTTVTGLVAGTSATLRWTVTNGTCSVFDEVVITNDILPVVSDQSDQALCDTTDFTMTQTAPTLGTGVWSIVSGTATITTASSPTTTVTGLVAGTSATLRWTVTNGTCSVFDEVVITNDVLPVVSDQSDQALCDTTDFTMTQTAPIVGTGVWSIVSGTATITTTSSPTTTVTGLVAGTSATLRWTVTNGTCSVFDEVVITNDVLPVVSDQSDQALCDTTDFTMTQTAPTVGTGVWSIVSGTATITTTSSPTTTVTGLVAGTSATLRWTVTNGTCSVFDEVVITNDVLPVVSNQSDQALCDTTDFTMTQTAPTVGTGVWSIISGTATITTTSSPTTTVTGLVAGTSATLRWTVTNGTCSVFDEVVITNDVLPVVSDQSDQALCDTTDFTMTQTAPTVGTGVWSIVSGTATITTTSLPTTTVTGLVAGTSATLRWTVTNGTCSVFDEVIITNDVLPVVSDQSDQALCNTTDFTMTQTAPTVGTGVWSIVSGTATITTTSSPTTTVTGLVAGTSATLRWTVTNGTCSVFDEVVITNDVLPVVSDQSDQALCDTTDFTMTQTAPTVGTGVWSIVSGTATITTASSPTTTVTGLVAGTSATLRWTVTNGTCSVFDEVVITNDVLPVVSDQSDQALCDTTDFTMTQTAPTVGTGVWSIVSGTATITTTSSPTTTVTGLVAGTSATLRWTVTNGTCSVFDEVVITNDVLPVVSDQSDQALCDTTDFTMTQTAPTVGTGVWSIISGTATITTASSPTTTVTGLVAGTSATLRWTVTNGTCSVFDEVVITNDVLPVVSDQSDQALCNTTDFTMTQTAPTVGTGVWSIVSGTATITTASSPTTTVTGLVAGTGAILRWTVTNGTCSVFDEVVITNDVLPVVSDQSDQALCDTTDFTMTQTAPTVGTGVWSIVSGTATITTASSPTTTVTGLVAGTSATLRWTVTNGTCSVFDEVVITNDVLPVVSDQSDQALCDTTDFTMTQTAPTVGTGVWSIVSGTATITTASSPTTTVTGLVAGTSATLRWTVTNGTCSVFDEVVITNDILPVVSDQSDQALCDTTDFTMTQTAPTVGTGVWSIISGTATITTASSPTTTVTGLVAGTSATLRWTVTNGTCSVFDEVVITNDVLPVVSDQSDQALCDTTDFTMTQTAPTVGTGVWSIVSGTATITTTSSPTTTVTGLVAGTSATLRWTVTNGTCSVFDEVVITNDVLPVVSDQSDQALCDTTDFTMTQTAPTVGTGVWSIISGTATITTASSSTTTVTGLVAGTSATLRWTVTNGTCSVFDEVVITNDVLPVVSDQSDQALCDTTDFTMTQTAPTVGTGVWSIVSGTATITTASSPTTTVTGLVAGTSATLRWTVTNGTCSVFDEVVITNDVLPVVSDQSDQALCDTTDFTMTQTAPTVGTGVWSIVSGTATITTASSPTTTVTGLVAGTGATLRWTVTNGTCSVFDEVVITNDVLPVVSDQSDQALCDTTDFTMTQTAPTVGTGVWSIVSGTATITTASSPTTTVTGLVAGTSATLRWTVTNGTCSVFDEVVITNNLQPSIGLISNDSDNSICAVDSIIFSASGGDEYEFLLDGVVVQVLSTKATFEAVGLTDGQEVTVRVIDNSTGCESLSPGIVITVSSTGQCLDTDGDGILDNVDVDDDNDGIPDSSEGTGDTDGDGIPDSLDLDSDNDGILDVDEGGNGDLDTNGDGVIDSNDTGYVDSDNDGQADDSVDTDEEPDTDGDGVPDYQDLDSDNDGINDVIENGNGDLDTNNDGVIDSNDTGGSDSDEDGISDSVDSDSSNFGEGNGGEGDTVDTDGDGVPDYQDLDSDDDGINDITEGGNDDEDGNGLVDGPDSDGDGILDEVDEDDSGFGDAGNTDVNDTDPTDPNSGGTGVVPDSGTDSDGDGISDSVDGDDTAFGDFIDTDGDGIPDNIDVDDDNDGIPDSAEGTGDTDGDGIPDSLDLDSDNDGILDVDEGGNGDLDTNGDGVIDSNDTGYVDSDNDGQADGSVDTDEEPDTDGDGVPDYQDLDSDNDGINDVIENGNGDLDTNNDGVIDSNDTGGSDSDEDGISDSVDSDSSNFGEGNGGEGDTVDTDGDGVPDYQDLDSDDDGINDITEGGNDDEDGNGLVDGPDSDGDGILDEVDEDDSGFGDTGNTDVNDTDPTDPNSGGTGVVPDSGTDSDGDGISDSVDGDDTAFGDFIDTDGDGIPDNIDVDDDNDGIPDSAEGTGDTDGDGIPDSLDLDSDNDGILDVDEGGNGDLDTNGDGVIDSNDTGYVDSDNDGQADDSVDTEEEPDTDGDGVPDYQDLDSDNDGINDVIENGNGDLDTNNDGVIDSNDTGGSDSDEDGISDSVDSDSSNFGEGNGGEGDTVDTDGDGVPDYQDLDSDDDGINDITEGGNDDEDGNGIVDGPDSDGDGILDEVDEDDSGFGDTGNSDDLPDGNSDGIPDFLDPNEGGGTGVLPDSGTDSDGDGISDSADLDDTVFGDAVGVDDCVIVYNEFTPNNDGSNDTLIIDCIENYPNNTLEIFNRWGNLVYSKKQYKNTWDGTSNGRANIQVEDKLPSGTYFYVLDLGNGNKVKKGWIYINRE
ncbi:PKD-like domain-containing protein [Tenacibaculum sp. nBUS_03]|uniref:PKD-like domain-containing protein n=1 Tax=Tenacibaculum sp. nBUS_03 TaxID=3395320 RepID=UPI003EBE5360